MIATYTELTAWTVTCLSGGLSGVILGAQRVPTIGSMVAVSAIAGTAFVACSQLLRASRESRERG